MARRRHFGPILGVWAGSGSQMRVGRRSWRLLGDFMSQDGSNLRPKMAPSWSQNGIKIDAKIGYLFVAFEIDFWWNFGGFCEENGSKTAPKPNPKNDINFEGQKPSKR